MLGSLRFALTSRARRCLCTPQMPMKTAVPRRSKRPAQSERVGIRVAGALVLTLGALGAACQTAPPPQLGGPTPVLVPQDQNPDVIWVVRPIEVQKEGSFRRDRLVLFGLFACYRSPQPGAPTCYLSRTDGDGAALVWPDDPEGYLLPQAGGRK